MRWYLAILSDIFTFHYEFEGKVLVVLLYLNKFKYWQERFEGWLWIVLEFNNNEILISTEPSQCIRYAVSCLTHMRS